MKIIFVFFCSYQESLATVELKRGPNEVSVSCAIDLTTMMALFPGLHHHPAFAYNIKEQDRMVVKTWDGG